MWCCRRPLRTLTPYVSHPGNNPPFKGVTLLTQSLCQHTHLLLFHCPAAGCWWLQQLLYGQWSPWQPVIYDKSATQQTHSHSQHLPLAIMCHCLQLGAGGTSSFCMASGPQLYAWGKLKVSGDNTTHPTPLEDLSGWHVSVCVCGGGGGGEVRDTGVSDVGHFVSSLQRVACTLA